MPKRGVFTPFDIERFEKALNYIKQHYRDSCSGEQLAVEVSMDLKLLRRGIFSLTGFTIHGFLVNIRLEKATIDLADFKNSINYIALKHGFCSSSHFSKKFKSKTGQTPNKYRFQLRNN